MKRALTPILVTLGVWSALVLLLLVEVFPFKPSSPMGWVIFCLAGPPTYLLLDAVGEYVLSKTFSWKRAGFAFLVLTGALGATLYLLASAS